MRIASTSSYDKRVGKNTRSNLGKPIYCWIPINLKYDDRICYLLTRLQTQESKEAYIEQCNKTSGPDGYTAKNSAVAGLLWDLKSSQLSLNFSHQAGSSSNAMQQPWFSFQRYLTPQESLISDPSHALVLSIK